MFYLHNPINSVPLYCVFHSIRFKVNKRLEYSGTPFFMPSCKLVLILFNYSKFNGIFADINVII